MYLENLVFCEHYVVIVMDNSFQNEKYYKTLLDKIKISFLKVISSIIIITTFSVIFKQSEILIKFVGDKAATFKVIFERCQNL